MKLFSIQYFFDLKQIQVTTKENKGFKISMLNKRDTMQQIETLKS
jgi:hypothetical protein